ncbi:MAG TPA: M20 aminoacylase family protein [Thermohalobaculum sp.]|nr:M20 aminoacylase family protein [Thermohalobaculum sp.]
MRPIPNSIAARAGELAEWRHDLHRHPELGYAEERTARVVAERLAAFGFDAVETGIGGTGVVGVLHGRGDGAGERPAIMLRADMDALPITEATGAEYASRTPGVMHACGHDGHTTMLLGAARHLAETRNFAGTVYFCFQPAEEGGAGAKAMLDDGLFERFRPRAVYGMHNWPGLAVGEFAVKDGPVMAAAGEFTIAITGKGGHAARPHDTRDPIVAGAQLVTALQTVVSRVVDPLQPAVLSVTRFRGGSAYNVIPDRVELMGTIRTFDEAVYAQIQVEVERIAGQLGGALGVAVEVGFGANRYPPTVNDPAEADFVEGVLRAAFGDARVHRGHAPSMAGEDFAFLAREVPGAYVLIGNGDSAPLHHPAYDFSDAAAPLGAAYWVGLVERALPREGARDAAGAG